MDARQVTLDAFKTRSFGHTAFGRSAILLGVQLKLIF